ncbi:MAG: Rne/Rng family ribonuclease [Bacillota bacterium]
MNEIIIDVQNAYTRVAALENEELAEIYVERNLNESTVGNIYKGRVENVLQGMQAAFVDIGIDKNTFLYVKDAIPNAYFDDDEDNSNYLSQYKDVQINDILKTGQEIIVQVVKEPIDTKGARVTTHITLPGRYLVLMPTVEYIGISRRIEDEVERDRLKEVVSSLKPEGMGLIVRTAAEGCTEKDFNEDLDFLLKLWEKIKKNQKSGAAPRIIHKDLNIVYRTVRDMFTKDTDRFVVNSREHYEKVLELVSAISPQLSSRVHYFDKGYDIFDYYHITNQIKKMLSRKVWLRSGGYLVIDQTEALTSIDVNTGKFVGSVDLKDTVLKTNVEAAREIARQLRLRDIGGIVIVDFIDMPDKEHEKIVIEVLKNALKKDRTRTTVFGMTQLGLLEMTRKKVRQRAEDSFMVACPCCEGEGKVLMENQKVSEL